MLNPPPYVSPHVCNTTPKFNTESKSALVGLLCQSQDEHIVDILTIVVTGIVECAEWDVKGINGHNRAIVDIIPAGDCDGLRIVVAADHEGEILVSHDWVVVDMEYHAETGKLLISEITDENLDDNSLFAESGRLVCLKNIFDIVYNQDPLEWAISWC